MNKAKKGSREAEVLPMLPGSPVFPEEALEAFLAVEVHSQDKGFNSPHLVGSNQQMHIGSLSEWLGDAGRVITKS